MLLSLPILLLALAHLVAAHDDWNQCYYARDAVAPPGLLPCHNETDVGPVDFTWCCFAGDNCLEHGGCWDPNTVNNTGTTNTYQYGCNDPKYEHGNCPKKCGLDPGKSPWVGLVSCVSDDRATADQQWACNHPDTCGKNCPTEPDNADSTRAIWPFTLIELPDLPSHCADLGRVVSAFYGPTSIPNEGSVPTAYTGTSKPPATRVPTRNRPSTNTPTGSSDPEENEFALGSGAIAGIAVGSTLGVVAAILGIFCLWRRRRNKPRGQAAAPAPQVPTAPRASSPGMAGSPGSYPYDKHSSAYTNTPSTFSDGLGIQRPVSDMSMSTDSAPVGSPRFQASPYYQQGTYPAQSSYGAHAELSDDTRVMHEMPAIRERSERSELP